MSCPDCFSGHVHEGQPRGNVTKLYGLDTYTSEPTGGRPVKGIIVIIPDAFGWEFVNNRLLADHYADKGNYKVYLPDFMNGTAAPAYLLDSTRAVLAPGNYLYKPYNIFWTMYGFILFIVRNRPARSHPVVQGWFSQLRKEEGDTLPIGAAGFCWGGKHAVLLAQGAAQVNGKPLIDAAFAGHPGMLDFPADIDKITLPVSFAIPELDNQISLERAKQIRTIVESKPESARGELTVYEKCGHGFCVRADVKFEDSLITKQALAAEDQCIEWFNKLFKIGS